MATASDVLRIAAAEIGKTDGTKYGKWYQRTTGAATWYGAIGVPWCAMFASWVFAQAGARCAGLPEGYCPNILAKAIAADACRAARNAQPGDVVLFDWDGNRNPDHVGIVERNFGSYLQTIEGNVSGRVMRRTRAYGVVRCCVRPQLDEEPAPETSTALVVDGIFGERTCKALQRRLQALGYYKGYKVDGVFGNVTKREYQRYLQKLGLYNGVIDGVFGVLSVKAEQTRLRALGYYDRAVDGARGPYTKMALQRALNDHKL